MENGNIFILIPRRSSINFKENTAPTGLVFPPHPPKTCLSTGILKPIIIVIKSHLSSPSWDLPHQSQQNKKLLELKHFLKGFGKCPVTEVGLIYLQRSLPAVSVTHGDTGTAQHQHGDIEGRSFILIKVRNNPSAAGLSELGRALSGSHFRGQDLYRAVLREFKQSRDLTAW